MDDVARAAAEDRVELILAGERKSTVVPPFLKHGNPFRKYQHHGRWQTLPASVPTFLICGVATLLGRFGQHARSLTDASACWLSASSVIRPPMLDAAGRLRHPIETA